MMTAEVPNVIRGARHIDHNGYIIDVVQGRSYAENKDAFIEIATPIQAGVFEREIELAREFMIQNLPDDEEGTRGIVSFMLARPREANPCEYVGYAIEREIPIVTSQGDVNLLYMARTIKEEHRRKGLGRFFAQEALALHNRVGMVGIRTQNPASVWSLIEAGIVREGELFPFEQDYKKDPLAQEVMVGLFFRIRRFGTRVDWYTGVSPGDIGRANPAYIPDLDHAPTMNILRRMKGEFRMNFERGDSMVVVSYV